MDFEKKMKIRQYVAIFYCVLGAVLILGNLLMDYENHFILPFGIALLIIGVLRMMQNRKITKNEQTMHQREVMESDERNILISERARSWTFIFSVVAAGFIVMVLSVLGYHEQAQPFSWFVCAMIGLYWVFYLILKRKY